MNKKKYILIAAAVIVVIGGIVTFKNIQGKRADKSAFAIEDDLGIPIELVTVGKSHIVEDISYIGTISSKKSTRLSPTIGGQILNMYVEEGSVVQSGDILAKIDDSQLAASHLTTQKKLETLRTNYSYLNGEVENFHSTNPLVKKKDTLTSNYEYIKGEREKYQQLYEEGAIAKTEYEKIKQEEDTVYLQLEEIQATANDAYNKLKHERHMVERQIDELASSINEMEIKIDETLIRAPRKGLVKKIYYEEGELAQMGMPFAEIDDNDEFLVNVNITESDLNKINLEDKVALKIKGVEDEIITRVSKINSNINPETRVGTIEIGPIKAEEGVSLVSGNSAELRIIINEVKDKLVIPKSTIKKLDDENIVYLYKDGIVTERKITTGLTVGENTEVIEGLVEGDKIAAKNLSKLYQDAKAYVFKGAEE